MAERVICCVAELEPFEKDDPKTADCEACGLNVLRVTYDAEDLGSYAAPVFLGGGGLESWSFDGGELIPGPYEYDGPVVIIDYPPGVFQHLCVRYNREGKARLNVVAVDVDTQEKIRPKSPVANGKDAACPIAQATLDGAPFPLESFAWDGGQMTILPQSGPALGAFTTEPESVPGEMKLLAKPTLGGGPVYGYKFQSWERNRLSKWQKGTEHQWPGDGPEIAFDQNSYQGLVAYYRRYKLETGWTEPITKPQPIEYGYPLPLRRLFAAIRAVFARLTGRR